MGTDFDPELTPRVIDALANDPEATRVIARVMGDSGFDASWTLPVGP